MKRFAAAFFLTALFAFRASAAPAVAAGVSVDALLRSMSLDEKIGQMVQIDLAIIAVPNSSPIRLDETKLREALVTYKIGSFINIGVGHALSRDEWVSVNKTIQDMIRAETPRRIPLLYGIDSIHGANYILDSTLFPQNIAMAAARNPELTQRCAEISALETRAAGLRWNFAPVLDVGRQPLWSRFPETLGEDPCLASVLGVASVHGFQDSHELLRAGDTVIISFVPISLNEPPPDLIQLVKADGTISIPTIGSIDVAGKTEMQLKRAFDARFSKMYVSFSIRLRVVRADYPVTVAACAKHFVGYSLPFNGADRSPALIPHPYLREYLLPPFRAAVKAGVKTIMVDSGDVNGVPVHASKYLLTDVLRGELGFKGVIVSDWQDVIRLHTIHHVAATPAEAVRMSVDAGIDMSMVPLD